MRGFTFIYLIIHFFAQSSVLLMMAWSFIEAIAGFSCVANIAVIIDEGSSCCVVLCREIACVDEI
jgi:hypothetical protein